MENNSGARHFLAQFMPAISVGVMAWASVGTGAAAVVLNPSFEYSTYSGGGSVIGYQSCGSPCKYQALTGPTDGITDGVPDWVGIFLDGGSSDFYGLSQPYGLGGYANPDPDGLANGPTVVDLESNDELYQEVGSADAGAIYTLSVDVAITSLFPETTVTDAVELCYTTGGGPTCTPWNVGTAPTANSAFSTLTVSGWSAPAGANIYVVLQSEDNGNGSTGQVVFDHVVLTETPAVPEPGTTLLTGGAFFLAAWLKRRCRRGAPRIEGSYS
jgi:hypothetical protein